MISIVIPAHNEASVIARLLESITQDAETNELEIIVGCNGCTDETAQICRDFHYPVVVCETEKASKVAGLNIADRAATCYPRLYIDADVQISLHTIREVANVLQSDSVLASAPSLQVDVSRSSWLVRCFYTVWQRRPYMQQAMVGSGLYAVSEAGRARFLEFPEIISDDGYFLSQFARHERQTAPGYFTIVAPTNLWDLIRVKTRSRLGLWQLETRFPKTNIREKTSIYSAAVEILKCPRLIPCAVVYLAVIAITRYRAKRMLQDLDEYKWERDESSRNKA